MLNAPKTMSSALQARTIILTAGVAATTVTGAWYGAGLKTNQDIKQVRINLHSRSLQSLRSPLLSPQLRGLSLTGVTGTGRQS